MEHYYKMAIVGLIIALFVLAIVLARLIKNQLRLQKRVGRLYDIELERYASLDNIDDFLRERYENSISNITIHGEPITKDELDALGEHISKCY